MTNKLLLYLQTTFTLITAFLLSAGAATGSLPVSCEPDIRLVNFTLPHPHAEIHVPHPEQLLHRRRSTRGGEDDNERMSKRDNVYGFYECSQPNFEGDCHWTQIPFSGFADGANQCFNRRYGPLGSMGPDRGVSCHVYSNANCDNSKGDGDDRDGFMYPGTGDCSNDPWFKSSYLAECPVSWRCRVVS